MRPVTAESKDIWRLLHVQDQLYSMCTSACTWQDTPDTARIRKRTRRISRSVDTAAAGNVTDAAARKAGDV